MRGLRLPRVRVGRPKPSCAGLQVGESNSIQVFGSDVGVPGEEFILRNACLIERIVVADAVESDVDVGVGNAEKKRATSTRVERTGGDECALLFEIAEIGTVRFNKRKNLVKRPTVAQDCDGVHVLLLKRFALTHEMQNAFHVKCL